MPSESLGVRAVLVSAGLAVKAAEDENDNPANEGNKPDQPPPTALSDVVKTQHGYHIIKVEATSVMPLADVKNGIKAQLQNQQLEKQMTETLTKQKAALNVKINDFK